MSANLDLVRSIVADWEHGDYSRADWADPEIEYVYPDEGPELDPTTTGVARMNERWRESLDAWRETRYEATAVRELDPDRVLVIARFTGQGKTSGLEIDKLGEVATVFHLNAGKVSRLTTYLRAKDALADLSLTPDE
jgi:hypothetical protein